MESTLNYVTFETKSVETFGKGKPYSAVEKVETPIKYSEFQVKLRWVFILQFLFQDSIKIKTQNLFVNPHVFLSSESAKTTT